MADFKDALEEYLSNFVPDVYQKSIYAIDYKKLKDRGIKLITFDVDDTIAPKDSPVLPREAIALVSYLKNQLYFEVMLLSNAGSSRVQGFADRMDVEYRAKAKKPSTRHFQEIQNSRGLAKAQMAHVGNSIVNDVAGGNAFGITTCLVRPVSHEKAIAPELERRGMWHKHHREKKGDQYYQLGETQKN